MPHFTIDAAVAPQPEDRVGSLYDTEAEAVEVAERRAACNWSTPIAIRNDRDEIIHLFLCGQRFTPTHENLNAACETACRDAWNTWNDNGERAIPAGVNPLAFRDVFRLGWNANHPKDAEQS